MIEVNNLSKIFKVHKKEPGLMGSMKSLFKRNWIEKNAVENVSFKVGPGEIVGLIGANGAGKTTLVKMLSGIIHPSSGSAKVLGHVPWERSNELRNQISLIMGQKASLWWDLPALDCFLLLKEIYQIPENKYHERLSFLTETLQIKDQLKIQIRRLSLGERMKVELMAALLHSPSVVYLDEPTIGLDLTAQNSIREFILKYRRENSPAMILTSHYMEDIEKLCKRIIIIKDGKLIYDGELKKIHQNFAHDKMITARHLLGADTPLKDFPQNLGELYKSGDDFWQIKIKREKIAEAASYLLKNYPVVDLNIEEQEISIVIESIIRKGFDE